MQEAQPVEYPVRTIPWTAPANAPSLDVLTADATAHDSETRLLAQIRKRGLEAVL